MAAPRAAAVLIAIAAAASMFTLAASWATCIDIGGRHSGVLSAAMNTAGQIGGILSPIVLAYVVEIFADWAIPLYVLAGLYPVGVVLLAVDPARPPSGGIALEGVASTVGTFIATRLLFPCGSL